MLPCAFAYVVCLASFTVSLASASFEVVRSSRGRRGERVHC
jgi:hypothetical protein